MAKCFYITTPIYYVNAKPHIGHAYTTILCDAFTRFRKLIGEPVFYLTGTDEHGTKVEKAAREQNKDPKQYVDEIVPQFKQLWKLLNVEYDYFIRTTDASHKQVVQNILRELEAKGEIYKAKYEGWYCTPCESFWTELQLVERKCPDCHREVQRLAEENYFFKLSKYQKDLIKHIESNPDFIKPEIRRNEVLAFLNEPLEDLCITRPRSRLSWGIEYPNSPDHVVYVWFDALVNYVSAVGYTIDNKKFDRYWPADIHMIGKDILRQHAVYWPIMLMACGVALPKTVLAHGWWMLAGEKVSKSRGNIVAPEELVKKYGVDALRYFLLREVTLGADGTFSEDLFAERYRSDLANNLGNLWFRIASMLQKYCDGRIPVPIEESRFTKEEFRSALWWPKVREAMLSYQPRIALQEIWNVLTAMNQFIETNKPWVLAKDTLKKKELEIILATFADLIAQMAIVLLPFIPTTAKKILNNLKLKTDWVIKGNDFPVSIVQSGTVVERGEALFPRLDEEK